MKTLKPPRPTTQRTRFDALVLVLFGSWILTACSGESSSTPIANAESTPIVEPDVQFEISQDDPLDMAFTVTNSEEFEPDSFLWNFGDGETSTSVRPTHSYSQSGIYEVSLETSDLSGRTARIVFDVSLNSSPQVNIVLAEAVEGATMTYMFIAQASDLESNPSENDFDWRYGDGRGGTGTTVNHTYAEPGLYTVSVTYMDEAGSSATASTNVEVAGPPEPEEPEDSGGATPDAGPAPEVDDPLPEADPGIDDPPIEEPGDEPVEPAPDNGDNPIDDPVAVVIQNTLASGILHDFEQPLAWMDEVFLVHATGSDVAYAGDGALELRLLEQGNLDGVLVALKSLFLIFYENSPEVHVRWYQYWDRDVQFDLLGVRTSVQSTLDALSQPLDADAETFVWEIVDKLESQPEPPILDMGWHCIQIQLYHNAPGAADGSLHVLANGTPIFELTALEYPDDSAWIDAVAVPFLEGHVVNTDAEITRIDDLEFQAMPIACD